jgi:enoyl-CoA hydratase/carnithine racemase
LTGVAVSLEARGALGRVATLTVDNQAKLNVLDPPRMAEMERALARLAADEQLRVLVLRGAGSKAFIGGADIGTMAGLDPATARAFISGLHRVCEGLRRLPVPAIARIEGFALGAGLEIAAACDMRVAASGAKFGMPEVKVGIPSVIEAALLPQLIGWGRARRLLFTGETIEAGEAERWGLVERVVQTGELDAAVEEWVAAILAAGPRAIRLQKSLIRQWEELATAAAIRRGIDTFVEAYATAEPAERMAAFLRRRRPQPSA